MRPTLIVTGPLSGMERYAEAAHSVGWDPIIHPLLEVRHRIVHLGLGLEREPDWICVTSKNAIKSLQVDRERFARVPCAAIGSSCAEMLREYGYKVEIEGARTARELAARLLKRADRPRLVLWPRGSLSDELARYLRRREVQDFDPIVYETTERAGGGALPSATGIFFASPSAVYAHSRKAQRGEPTTQTAIAIGPTTLAALRSASTTFFRRIVALPAPSPAALKQTLFDLQGD
jgi:uroporphyrinogen-III synthase